MNDSILVVGGAGYIGSHMIKLLHREGYRLTTLDDLSSGHRDAVVAGDFVLGDIGDVHVLDKVFSSRRFDAVMHFASFIQVGESVIDPAKYYVNNVVNTLNLINAMVRHDVTRFVFSSSAAIFGDPAYLPIDEQHPQAPSSPYGASKAMIERVLRDYDRAYGLKAVSLRYFNAAGADAEGQLGERHEPETHLIPLVLQVASGRRESVSIFGDDYDTPDGTCLRDYIHVADLCDAHLLALRRLTAGADSDSFNLGSSRGYSVREIINCATAITGRDIPVVCAPRRAGDPAALIADNRKAASILGWRPQYPDLETIIAHAWDWECQLVAARSCVG